MNRRNVLLGLGTIVAGGGAALGTGAFSSVEADRSATIEVADDSDAYLSLSGNDNYISDGDGIVEFTFDDLNKDAVTNFDNVFNIENNGSNKVTISIDLLDQDGTEIDGDDANILNEVIDMNADGSDISADDDEDYGFKFDTRPSKISNAETHQDIEDALGSIDQFRITANFDSSGNGD